MVLFIVYVTYVYECMVAVVWRLENGQQAKDLHKHFQMPEWKVNCLLAQYGLPVSGDVNQKRKFAVGAFLWSC